MDLSNLTDDQLADAGKAFIDELHARADALPNGTFRFLARERVAKLHGHMNILKRMCADEGVIQPMSGGDAKTP